MFTQILEGIWDNEYLFLSVATSLLVIVPLCLLYLVSFIKHLVDALP